MSKNWLTFRYFDVFLLCAFSSISLGRWKRCPVLGWSVSDIHETFLFPLHRIFNQHLRSIKWNPNKIQYLDISDSRKTFKILCLNLIFFFNITSKNISEFNSKQCQKCFFFVLIDHHVFYSTIQKYIY